MRIIVNDDVRDAPFGILGVFLKQVLKIASDASSSTSLLPQWLAIP